ncbi:MAG: hypothetical protein JSU88_00525 [Nitrospinaceae bacterium]|jgi:hypothetical protein|nr:MAG: hypothetical protein JSU88_00525 [Nitrospinaceae bacterium]
MAEDVEYVKNEKGEVAVACQIKLASNCAGKGAFCEDEEDARDWVEEECWVFSGVGYICLQCNEQIMRNLREIRPKTAR